MTRRRILLGAGLGLLVALTLLVSTLAGAPGAPGSTLSRGPRGWLVARRYVEERGVRTRLRRRPLEPLAPGEVLVAVFPWQRWPSAESLRETAAHVRRGGRLVLAWSGRDDAHGERRLLREIGLEADETPPLPLSPWRWYEAARAEWTLVAEGVPASGGLGRVRRTERVPVVPSSARVLFRRAEDARPLVAVARVGRGEVFLLPAELLSNARLHEEGRIELLEMLTSERGRAWVFDEYHHGLSAPADAGMQPSLAALDLWIVHALVVYALAVMALARRLGPPWRDPPVTSGSARSFFVGVGAFAAGLGRREETAGLLLARARELDPAVDFLLPVSLDDDATFLELARAVGRAQKRRS